VKPQRDLHDRPEKGSHVLGTIIGFIIIGLVAGFIARAVVSGRQAMTVPQTILLVSSVRSWVAS
jgi:hypothetical protein